MGPRKISGLAHTRLANQAEPSGHHRIRGTVAKETFWLIFPRASSFPTLLLHRTHTRARALLSLSSHASASGNTDFCRGAACGHSVLERAGVRASVDVGSNPGSAIFCCLNTSVCSSCFGDRMLFIVPAAKGC